MKERDTAAQWRRCGEAMDDFNEEFLAPHLAWVLV